MARMIPNTPLATPSLAEARLFERLNVALPDPYVVLHDVKWLEKTERRAADRPTECEADFLVLHPGRGALVVEVKGGEVLFDASVGQWLSTSVSGATHTIKDPSLQAQRACHSLLRLARSNARFPDWAPFGYAVAFPD